MELELVLSPAYELRRYTVVIRRYAPPLLLRTRCDGFRDLMKTSCFLLNPEGPRVVLTGSFRTSTGIGQDVLKFDTPRSLMIQGHTPFVNSGLLCGHGIGL